MRASEGVRPTDVMVNRFVRNAQMKISPFLTDSFFERLKQDEYLAIAVVFI